MTNSVLVAEYLLVIMGLSYYAAVNGLCIQRFAELNTFMGGVKHRHFLGGYKSFSTEWRAFKLIQDKDMPFGYADTKFQTSTLNQ